MRYKIDRLIRSRKTIAIVLVVSLIMIQLCQSCANTSKSEYFVKTEGSCHQQTSIKIIDESNGVVPAGRVTATSRNSHFKHYVNSISKHVFTKVDEMGRCQGNWYDPKVELVFVYRPLISEKILPFNFEPTNSR
jgi:hypothetical protein